MREAHDTSQEQDLCLMVANGVIQAIKGTKCQFVRTRFSRMRIFHCARECFWRIFGLSIFPLIFLNIFIIETGIPLHTQKQMIRLQIEALVNWNQFFRDICSRWLLDHPIRFL